ncbi:MAG: hypothetical protein ACI9VI_000454 [Candidatus Azotimanducaceae bacterium]|jgi:hypothetical protein
MNLYIHLALNAKINLKPAEIDRVGTLYLESSLWAERPQFNQSYLVI